MVREQIPIQTPVYNLLPTSSSVVFVVRRLPVGERTGIEHYQPNPSPVRAQVSSRIRGCVQCQHIEQNALTPTLYVCSHFE